MSNKNDCYNYAAMLNIQDPDLESLAGSV